MEPNGLLCPKIDPIRTKTTPTTDSDVFYPCMCSFVLNNKTTDTKIS